jgi:hypothetical protein
METSVQPQFSTEQKLRLREYQVEILQAQATAASELARAAKLEVAFKQTVKSFFKDMGVDIETTLVDLRSLTLASTIQKPVDAPPA